MKTDTIPKASQVAAALGAVQRALTQSILLGQTSRINDDSLSRAAEADDPIGHCAKAFIESRTALNVALQANHKTANATARELIQPFLSHLFKQTVPGKVALPDYTTGRIIEEHVVSLQSICADDNVEPNGMVETANSTRFFLCKDGHAYFLDDICL